MNAFARTAVALALFGWPLSAAHGATADVAVKALTLAAVDQKQLSVPAGRYALVRAARDYCAEVGRSYPRNSPAEDSWLSVEIAGDGDRPMRAARSPELGRRMAANFADTCLQGAQTFETNEDKRTGILVMALAFARFRGDAKYFADKNGVDSERFGLDILPGITVEALLVAALSVH